MVLRERGSIIWNILELVVLILQMVLMNNKLIWLWHRRLGHPSFTNMKHLFPTLFTTLLPGDFHCETCTLAKSHRINFPFSISKSLVPFALLHSDVWGLAPIPSNLGHRWFVIFIDDSTRMTWLLKHKSDVLNTIRSFRTMAQTQFFASVQIMRSDNGGEFVNKKLQEYLNEHSILHETTCP